MSEPVDLNDPETKKEIDAFVEHEKHEPLGERVDDVANSRPAWAWGGWMIAGLVFLGIVYSVFSRACS